MIFRVNIPFGSKLSYGFFWGNKNCNSLLLTVDNLSTSLVGFYLIKLQTIENLALFLVNFWPLLKGQSLSPNFEILFASLINISEFLAPQL